MGPGGRTGWQLKEEVEEEGEEEEKEEVEEEEKGGASARGIAVQGFNP